VSWAVPRVVIAHIEGWSIYSETIDDVRTAFSEAGIAERLVAEVAGRWALPTPGRSAES
jgi:hypothetical protein